MVARGSGVEMSSDSCHLTVTARQSWGGREREGDRLLENNLSF